MTSDIWPDRDSQKDNRCLKSSFAEPPFTSSSPLENPALKTPKPAPKQPNPHLPPVRLILHPFSNFSELISPAGYINSVHTRCIVKTSGFTRGVCKNRGFYIKFKGFLVEFLHSRRSWENQKPPENRQKMGLFWASPFTMHLVCTLLMTSQLHYSNST